MRASALATTIGASLHGGDAEVGGIAMDSRAVQRGDLFVAVPGARTDGARFIPAALERGAAAVCATRPVEAVPTIVAADPRAALPFLAAAFYGHPAREFPLIGITGSLGKTSTSLLTQRALAAAGIAAGVIGSLGIRFDGRVVETGMTTPEAPAIHRALREMLAAGADVAVMEVTSHSIMLQRVAGLVFSLGALTNIVPDEHLEFHPSPEHYVRTKVRFFDMLAPAAPLVVNLDDALARDVTRGLSRPLVGVTLAGHAEAAVSVEGLTMTADGSRFTLRLTRELPRLRGAPLAPGEYALRLPILGRQQVANAAVAAAVALLAGADPGGVARALAAAEPMRRRMEIIIRDGPVVLDDTVGNPASVRAVFEAAAAIPHERLRVAYAIRGMRGVTINEANAAALAEEVRRARAELTVTASEDAADERNRVTADEAAATLETLRRAGVPFAHEARLTDAIARTVGGAGPRDLVLLLGAQAMDRGAELARAAVKRGMAG